MTISEQIERIADGAAFEQLGCQMLRSTEPECANLEHLGSNAQGRTIKGPVDCFARVSGVTPPLYVGAAFSTDKLSSLRSKWLQDPNLGLDGKDRKKRASESGDLVKFRAQAEILRKEIPDAKFVVYLCTNKQPNLELFTDVEKAAYSAGIEVRIRARSSFRDFLELKPIGQYLRQKYFGVDADFASKPLLTELVSKLLEGYGASQNLPASRELIETQALRSIQRLISKGERLIGLIGRSGSGKSTLCYQLLADNQARGSFSIRLPANLLYEQPGLLEAIQATLAVVHGNRLDTDSVAQVLQQLGEILVVIDDVNRTVNPVDCIKITRRWSECAKSSLKLTMIVPIWESHFSLFAATSMTEHGIAIFNLQKMLRCEAKALLSARQPSIPESDLERVIEQLDRDPILLRLWESGTNPSEKEGVESFERTYQVFNNFISRCLAEVATSEVAADIFALQDALEQLAQTMLQLRTTSIDLTTSGYSDDIRRVIRTIGRSGGILSVTKSQKIEFRHDRLANHLVVSQLVEALSDPELHRDTLSDPYFADQIAQALLLSGSEIAWRHCEAENPESVLAVVNFLPDQGLTCHRIEAIKRVVEGIPSGNSYLYREWLGVLSRNQSDSVVFLTEDDRLLKTFAVIRLANGDAEGILQNDNMPLMSAKNSHFDFFLGIGLEKHRRRIVDCCANFLSSASTDKERAAGLKFAGYCADPALAAAVRATWFDLQDPAANFKWALWASVRCCDLDAEHCLRHLIVFWSNLPAVGESLPGPLLMPSWELHFPLARGCPDAAVDFLVAVANYNQVLAWPILFLVQNVPNWKVLALVAQSSLDDETKYRESQGFFPVLSTIVGSSFDSGGLRQQVAGTNSGPLRPSREIINQALSAVRGNWALEANLLHRFWEDVEDGEWLKSVKKGHPGYSVGVLVRWVRGEHELLPNILECVLQNHNLLPVLVDRWRPELYPLIYKLLKDFEIPDDFSEPLRSILWTPRLTLSKLFNELEAEVLESPKLAMLALRFGDAGLTRRLMDSQFFRDRRQEIFSYYELAYPCHSPLTPVFVRCPPLGLDELTRLERLLPDIPDNRLANIAEWATFAGLHIWSQEKISREVTRRKLDGLVDRPVYSSYGFESCYRPESFVTEVMKSLTEREDLAASILNFYWDQFISLYRASLGLKVEDSFFIGVAKHLTGSNPTEERVVLELVRQKAHRRHLYILGSLNTIDRLRLEETAREVRRRS